MRLVQLRPRNRRRSAALEASNPIARRMADMPSSNFEAGMRSTTIEHRRGDGHSAGTTGYRTEDSWQFRAFRRTLIAPLISARLAEKRRAHARRTNALRNSSNIM